MTGVRLLSETFRFFGEMTLKTGSYIKIKNVQLYYNDGNIDLFDNPTEYTVNKSGLIYEDLASENVTGRNSYI